MPKHTPPWTTTVLPYIKLAWGGSIGTPAAEVWTNSLAWRAKDQGEMDQVHELGLAGLQANIGGLAAAISDWFSVDATDNDNALSTRKGAGIGKDAKLEWVKCNYINAAGHYEFNSNTFFYPAPIPGGGVTTASLGGGTYTPPWQLTTAITLRTAVSRGRGSHGRIYPPLAGGPPTGGKAYQQVGITRQMTNNFTGLINNINGGMYMGVTGYDGAGFAEHHPGNCGIVSVMPHTGPNAGAAPLFTVITGVEVDEVSDVQSRRVDRVPRATTARQSVTVNT